MTYDILDGVIQEPSPCGMFLALQIYQQKFTAYVFMTNI